MTDDIRYPTGRFHRPEPLSPGERAAAIEALDPLPAELGKVTIDLSPQQLDTLVALYAWHGRHHTAHVTRLRWERGWD